MQQKIIVVDDERAIADLVAVYLQNEGFAVRKYGCGAQALRAVKEDTPDLAILDIMLPDMDGCTLCMRIRETCNFPILMLTAKDAELDRITGLAVGADDYITKPFRPLELVARVKAQLRRYTQYNLQVQEKAEHVIALRGLLLNIDTHECTLDERLLSLTPLEFSILRVLCEHHGRVVSSEELFRVVWGEKYYENANNTVMVHIRHLRGKMKDSAERPKYIKTVWGVGYKIED